MGSSCFSRGNGDLVELIENYIEANGFQKDVEVEVSGTLCEEHCAEGPNVMINDVRFARVDAGVMLDLLKEHLKKE